MSPADPPTPASPAGSPTICTRCGGRGYESGGVDENDCGVTLTCRKCGGKCACGAPVYALGKCKPCYFDKQDGPMISCYEARYVARSYVF